MCSLIQSRTTGSLVYTPGLFLWAQPSPQLTTPAWKIRPSFSTLDKGPPESPWQESTPPLRKPTHIIRGVICCGMRSSQVVWLMTRISPFCRISAPLPGGDSKPGIEAGSSWGKPVSLGKTHWRLPPPHPTPPPLVRFTSKCLEITQEPADR